MTDDQIIAACRTLVARGTKPTLPEVKPLVVAFYQLPGNGAGGSLHAVLDDGNYERCFIWQSRDCAVTRGDRVGVALCDVLLLLSNSQRRRV